MARMWVGVHSRPGERHATMETTSGEGGLLVSGELGVSGGIPYIPPQHTDMSLSVEWKSHELQIPSSSPLLREANKRVLRGTRWLLSLCLLVDA